MKKRVRLIHWNADEAKQRAKILRAAGYEVLYIMQNGPEFLRDLRTKPPTAVVIDLSLLPSHGRDVGLGVRQTKATRHVPIVFVGGEPEKVARVKTLLPDAAFTSWNKIRSALKQAIAHPPENPVRPDSLLAGYSGTPLPKKLGIKANSVVALEGAPQGFRKTLGQLPEGAVLEDDARGPCDIVLWFVRSREELAHGMKAMAARSGAGRLWIIWPKKASGMDTDVRENDVRAIGMAAGMVDFKVCAVDATWSGLAFTRRKKTK
jgi:CheY-like chemotaxis protein